MEIATNKQKGDIRMVLISLVLTIAVVGFICWIVLQIPMPAIFRNILLGVIAFALVIWLLQSIGLLGGFGVPLVRLR